MRILLHIIFLGTITSVFESKENPGILIPSLSVSLLVYSVLTFFIGCLVGILFTKWCLHPPGKKELSTTPPAPMYEEISPPLTTCQRRYHKHC